MQELSFDMSVPAPPRVQAAPSDAGKTHKRKRHQEQDEAEQNPVAAQDDNRVGSLRDKIRDGRVCKLCGKRDTQPDDVVDEEKLFWARPPYKHFVPHGYYCIYCDRVYERRYKFGHPGGCDVFANAAGRDAKLLEEFKEWRAKLVAHIKDSDNLRSARMIWSRVDVPLQVLQPTREAQCSIIQPDDEVMSEGEYTQKHGGADKNGLGHQRVSIPGCPRGVLMPGKRLWKIRRQNVNKAGIVTKHQDNSSEHMLGEDMLQNSFQALEQGLFGTRATGAVMTLDVIMGSDRRQGTSASSSGAVAEAAPSVANPSLAAGSGGPALTSAAATAFGFVDMVHRLPSASAAASGPGTPAKAAPKTIGKNMSRVKAAAKGATKASAARPSAAAGVSEPGRTGTGK